MEDTCKWLYRKQITKGCYQYVVSCNKKIFNILSKFDNCPYCNRKIQFTKK